MQLTDLIQTLRLEYHDSDETSYLLDEEQLERALTRAVVSVNKDLQRNYSIGDNGEFSPALDDDDREVLLLYALVVACRMVQAKTSRNFSFSSGDKKVDKTKQPSYWAELARGYLAEYQQMVQERNPEFGGGIPSVIPMIYGSD